MDWIRKGGDVDRYGMIPILITIQYKRLFVSFTVTLGGHTETRLFMIGNVMFIYNEFVTSLYLLVFSFTCPAAKTYFNILYV